jgi:hypothetical protein
MNHGLQYKGSESNTNDVIDSWMTWEFWAAFLQSEQVASYYMLAYPLPVFLSN